jgi:hypothetical protein
MGVVLRGLGVLRSHAYVQKRGRWGGRKGGGAGLDKMSDWKRACDGKEERLAGRLRQEGV